MEEDNSKYFDPEKDLDFDENEDQVTSFYDLEKDLDEVLQPYAKQFAKICQEFNIPMVLAYQYKHAKDESNLYSFVVLPKNRSGDRIVTVAKTLLE